MTDLLIFPMKKCLPPPAKNPISQSMLFQAMDLKEANGWLINITEWTEDNHNLRSGMRVLQDQMFYYMTNMSWQTELIPQLMANGTVCDSDYMKSKGPAVYSTTIGKSAFISACTLMGTAIRQLEKTLTPTSTTAWKGW